MPDRISVAGLNIDPLRKTELLDLIASRIKSGEKTFLTTLYSEFLYAALRDREVMDLLNRANIAIPDGVGVVWARHFLKQPLTAKSFYGIVMQAWWQVVYTGASILLAPQKLYTDIPEKIVGADLVWDLADLAEKNNFTVFIWGGFGHTPYRVKEILEQQFPSLKIVGASNSIVDDLDTLTEVELTQPDILLCAFGPFTQERWISRNLNTLPIKFAVGLGGTFDYMTGARRQPPKFIRQTGLEWLYRLFTQPSRVRRIFHAFWGLIISLVRYKVFNSQTLRRNALAVVINKHNKVLLCRHKPYQFTDTPPTPEELLISHWQFPQGGLQEGEDAIAAAKRELHEETGIQSVELIGEAGHVNSYVWNNAMRPLLKSNYHNKGQEQFTVFLRFTGDDNEIILDDRELDAYQWYDRDKAVAVLEPVRQQHAAHVLAELEKLLEPDIEKPA